MQLPGRLKALLKAGIDRAVGRRLDALEDAMRQLTGELSRASEEQARRSEPLRDGLDSLRAEMAHRHADLLARLQELREIAAADLDGIPALRAQLLDARRSEGYRAVFSTPEPLVSIRI